jgi:hypothetical protein
VLVVVRHDMDAGNVSVRLHGKGNIGAKPKAKWWRIFSKLSKSAGPRLLSFKRSNQFCLLLRLGFALGFGKRIRLWWRGRAFN